MMMDTPGNRPARSAMSAGVEAVVDRLARAGVKSILNFVPRRIPAPPGVHVEDIDISATLEMLSFLSKGGDE